MAKLKKLRWKAEFFCQPAYKNVACVSIRDLDIFGNDGAMSSFLRIEMFINFQVNDNLYQAHQCGYCGDNSGRVSPENENSQREYAVDEQKYDNQESPPMTADIQAKAGIKNVKLRMMNIKIGRNHAKYGDTSSPK